MEQRILDILAGVNDELLTYTGPNMVDDEIIDSFELIALVSRLEDEFDIEIDAGDVTAENFGNKDCIIELIKKMVK